MPAPSGDAVRAAVAAYYAAVSAGEIEAAVAMFAADARMLDPVGAPAAENAEQRRQRYAGISAMFETFRVEPSFVAVCGAEAAARWSAVGRTRAGRDVTFDGISTFVFDADGRIAAMSAYWEMAAVVAALQA
ncbi:MAG TPA: nuclear transport factor 2 family protein [Dehalococcoidia bacterium]|nr:nuclear transport factor 2 family protein [Dehalococcoidia bacterium]